MSDSFTEVTSQGWFSRIGESIKGIVFGLLLIPGAAILLWWNEGRAVATANSLKEGAANMVHVDAANVDPANEGKLVHLTAEAKATGDVVDNEVGLRLPALRLIRKVEIYQWVEKKETKRKEKLGGGTETRTTYTYQKKWTDEPVDSSDFKDPDAHRNTGTLAVMDGNFTAPGISLGAFQLPPNMGSSLPGAAAHPLTASDLAGLSPALKSKVRLAGGNLYLGNNPEQPAIGDQRVSYETVAAGVFSVMAAQSGNSFRPYPTKAGKQLSFLKAGDVSAQAMIQGAVTTNRIITWAVRVGGFLLMSFGFMAVMRPLAILGSVIPLLGNIIGFGGALISFVLSGVISTVVIAVAWLAARPVLGIALLALAVVGLALLWKLAAASKRKAPAPA